MLAKTEGKRRRQKATSMAEDEMVGQYHQFNALELGQTPGDSEGSGDMPCCSPWSLKESDMTQ